MTYLDDDDALAEILAPFAPKTMEGGESAREERIIAGFEEIQSYVSAHGHLPMHGAGRDIFERIYAVRLDRFRALSECRLILGSLDHQGLLGDISERVGEVDDEELYATLKGIDAPLEIEKLVHVQDSGRVTPADEIAKRTRCLDFDSFAPLFQKVRSELKSGIRQTRRFAETNRIEKGDFFILGGQIGFVAEFGDKFIADYNIPNRRLRVIFDNGTEINMLLRSLQRALYKDESGRRITEPDLGPLFRDTTEDGDVSSGTIYVLRSRSSNDYIAKHRDVIHKIGVTGNEANIRVVGAQTDPTFLFADVEIVTTYKLFNVNRVKLENTLHRFFESARLNVEIPDNFGRLYRPREWYLVPLSAIEEAVNRIKDGSIVDVRYDVKRAAIVNHSPDV